MCELCGRMVREEGKSEISNMYLARAMWLFYDWGAFAKVKQMTLRFKFLLECPREDGNLSTTAGSVAGMGGGQQQQQQPQQQSQQGSYRHDINDDDFDEEQSGTTAEEPQVPGGRLRSALKK